MLGEEVGEMTAIERATRIKELVEQACKLHTGNTNEWVGLGLMTEAEYAAWERWGNLESKAYQAGEVAERAADKAVWNTRYAFLGSRGCHAYIELMRQRDELAAKPQEFRELEEALSAITPNRGHAWLYERVNASKEQIQALQEQLQAEFGTEPSRIERDRINCRIEAHHRSNTKVSRVLDELRAAARQAEKQAGNKAREDFLAAYPQEIKAGQQAEGMRAARLERRLGAIAAEIRQLLVEEIPAPA